MTIKAVFNGGQQTFKEYCDRCGERIRAIHISDITTKPDNDPRVVQILDVDDNNLTLKTPIEKLNEVSASFISRNLLTAAEATNIKKQINQSKPGKLAHGWRPQMMCTESIDIISGVTQSYCGNVNLPAFKTVILNNVAIGDDFDNEIAYQDASGSKVGADRFGNIIRLKSAKGLEEADSAIVYKGPFLTTWWKDYATPAERAQWTADAQSCSALIAAYGQPAVDDMTVVSNFASKRSWSGYMSSNC